MGSISLNSHKNDFTHARSVCVHTSISPCRGRWTYRELLSAFTPVAWLTSAARARCHPLRDAVRRYSLPAHGALSTYCRFCGRDVCHSMEEHHEYVPDIHLQLASPPACVGAAHLILTLSRVLRVHTHKRLIGISLPVQVTSHG